MYEAPRVFALTSPSELSSLLIVEEISPEEPGKFIVIKKLLIFKRLAVPLILCLGVV